MSGRELEVADDRAEPLLCLASKRQSKIGEGGSVIPLVGDLHLSILAMNSIAEMVSLSGWP
jgi:hypothetical protein